MGVAQLWLYEIVTEDGFILIDAEATLLENWNEVVEFCDMCGTEPIEICDIQDGVATVSVQHPEKSYDTRALLRAALNSRYVFVLRRYLRDNPPQPEEVTTFGDYILPLASN
jgi:hypothetical protein